MMIALENIDTLRFIFGSVIAIVIISLYINGRAASKDKSSKFDFEKLFVDCHGRPSLDKLGQFIALMVSTWAFVYYTLAYKLSEWFFEGYMVTWALAKAANKWLEYRQAIELASKKEDTK